MGQNSWNPSVTKSKQSIEDLKQLFADGDEHDGYRLGCNNAITDMIHLRSGKGADFRGIRDQVLTTNTNGTVSVSNGRKSDEMTLTFPSMEALTKRKPSLAKLMILCQMLLAQSNKFRGKVDQKDLHCDIVYSVEEYAKARGVTVNQRFNERIKDDLHDLSTLQFSAKSRSNAVFVNVTSVCSLYRGVIHVQFNPMFVDLLCNQDCSFMCPMPVLLMKIDTHTYQSAMPMCYVAMRHKFMNRGKSNEDILPVRTLLDVAEGIPPIENIKNENRNLTERLIEPLERNLDALSEIFGWQYCDKSGLPLTGEQLEKMYEKPDTVRLMKVKLTWKNYPLLVGADAKEERVLSEKEKVVKEQARKRQTAMRRRRARQGEKDKS